MSQVMQPLARRSARAAIGDIPVARFARARRFALWYFFAGAARFGKTDGNRLLAACHLFLATPAAQGSLFLFVHRTSNAFGCASGISPCHIDRLSRRATSQILTSASLLRRRGKTVPWHGEKPFENNRNLAGAAAFSGHGKHMRENR